MTTFSCPVCGTISHHPADVREGYCASCREWTGRPEGLDLETPLSAVVREASSRMADTARLSSDVPRWAWETTAVADPMCALDLAAVRHPLTPTGLRATIARAESEWHERHATAAVS